MNRNSSLCAAALLVLITSGWSTPAAGLVWKGRDGKAYASARPCLLANPACRPEQGMAAASTGVSPSSQSAAPASTAYVVNSHVSASDMDSDAQAPTLCMARGGWMHMPPCKPDAGDVTVRVLD